MVSNSVWNKELIDCLDLSDCLVPAATSQLMPTYDFLSVLCLNPIGMDYFHFLNFSVKEDKNGTIHKHFDQFRDPVTQRMKSDFYVEETSYVLPGC